MDLYIIRHGIAADSAATDRERPLTPPGRHQMRQLAAWMAGQGNVPQLIIASPLTRALETAQILAEGVGLDPADVVVDNVMSPGAQPERFCAMLKEHGAGAVAVVGHAPDVSVYTSFFTGGGWLSFGRANIACLEIHGPPAAETGSLRWFVNPRTLGF